MITENEIRNQIAIGKTLMEFSKLSHAKKLVNKVYIETLEYVLGDGRARYDKEDIQ